MKSLNYKKYLKNRKILNYDILFGKTRQSFLIGPMITKKFDEESFYRRIISSSIYSKRIYKCCFKKNARLCIKKYSSMLKDNQVIEVFKNGEIIKHNIIAVPKGVSNEK